MTTLGICTSSELGGDDPQALIDLGAPVARFVLSKAQDGLARWHLQQRRRCHGVISAETFDAFGGFSAREVQDHHHVLVLAQQHWGATCAFVEIGNEPDDPGSASMGLPAATWSHLLQTACQVFHANGNHDRPQLISGGLSTGQPSYLEHVEIPPCMLLGLHDYNSRLRGWPSAGYGFHELEAYLASYEPIWSDMAGVAISEWGCTDDAPPFAQEYIRRWLAIVREHPEVKLAEWFALSDRQHPSTPHGLIRRDGSRKPQFDIYATEARAPAVLTDHQKLALLAAPGHARR
jgi:hypothetical protein